MSENESFQSCQCVHVLTMMKITIGLRKKGEEKRARGKEKREWETARQPANLLFISSTRLNMHEKKKRRECAIKTQASPCLTLNQDNERNLLLPDVFT